MDLSAQDAMRSHYDSHANQHKSAQEVAQMTPRRLQTYLILCDGPHQQDKNIIVNVELGCLPKLAIEPGAVPDDPK